MAMTFFALEVLVKMFVFADIGNDTIVTDGVDYGPFGGRRPVAVIFCKLETAIGYRNKRIGSYHCQ